MMINSCTTKPLALEMMTSNELDTELQKGLAPLLEGKGISADDVDTLISNAIDIDNALKED